MQNISSSFKRNNDTSEEYSLKGTGFCMHCNLSMDRTISVITCREGTSQVYSDPISVAEIC